MQDHATRESAQPTVQTPDFALDLEIGSPLPHELSLLLARSELHLLDDELDRLIEKIRATRHAFSLELADKRKLAAHVVELQRELELLKSRKKQLQHFNTRIPPEILLEDLQTHQTQLTQLEESTTIKDSDYREQKDTLLKHIKKLKKELKQSVREIKSWLTVINKAMKKISRKKRKIEAQLKIGDISPTRFETEMDRLQKSQRVLDGVYQMLDALLKSIQKT